MSTVEVLASVDIVTLRLAPDAQHLQVLLHRREREPHAGQWALPGVIVNGRTPDISLEAAAERALREKTGWCRATWSRWVPRAMRFAIRGAGR